MGTHLQINYTHYSSLSYATAFYLCQLKGTEERWGGEIKLRKKYIGMEESFKIK
jgi:hypothetical protein